MPQQQDGPVSRMKLTAAADDLIDQAFIRNHGSIKIDAGTPKSRRLIATARAIDAQVGRRGVLSQVADRFGLILRRLMRRLHAGVLSFTRRAAIETEILKHYFRDRQMATGRTHARNRGRQQFVNQRTRPVLMH